MADLYHANFETETNDVTPAGWTAAGNFRTYTWVERGVTAVSGSNGVFSSDNQAGAVYTGIAARTDQAASIAFRIPALTTAGHRSWALMLRSNSAFNQYYRIILETDNTGLRLTIHAFNVGTTVLASSSSYSFSPAPGDLVRLEAFAIGSVISGRAWISGTARPDTISGSGTATASYATVTTTNTSISSGYAGMQLAGPSGVWFGGDNFVVTDGAGGEDYYYPPASPSTGVTLTGPTTGAAGTASANFSVGVTPVGGTITGTVVVTPSDGGAGGTFAPTTVSLTTAAPTGTFTYTASSTGAKTISVTNNGSLTNPSTITYTASASSAATAIVVSGPSTGSVGAASSNFTASANGTITGTVVITPAATGCTFTPATVSISSGTPTATFTCTAAAAGAKTISFTNNGSLTNQASLTYTASVVTAGQFVTDAWINNAETLRASEAFTGTWYSAGSIGSAGGTATLVSGTLSAGGVATVTGLTAGAGFFLGKSADGGVFYQAGAVS
jgi:hypothetical protein